MGGICFRVVIKDLARHFIERRFPIFRRTAVFDSCSAALHESVVVLLETKINRVLWKRLARGRISEIALKQTYESIPGFRRMGLGMNVLDGY